METAVNRRGKSDGRRLGTDGAPSGGGMTLVDASGDQQHPCIAGDGKGGYPSATLRGASPWDRTSLLAWHALRIGTETGTSTPLRSKRMGAASQMQRFVDHVVLLGGTFRADEHLIANIGQVYDLFGEHDPVRDPGAQNGLSVVYQWDRHNHGWRPEYCGGNRVCQQYHPELDLYATGRIRAVSVPGSDHMGYFASPDFVVNQTGLCQSSLYLPIQLRD